MSFIAKPLVNKAPENCNANEYILLIDEDGFNIAVAQFPPEFANPEAE